MTWLVAIVTLFLGALIQSVLPGVMFLGQVKWPILTGIVIYYALAREFDVMLLVSFCAGVLQDILSPIPLGYSAFCFMLAGCVISGFKNLVLAESMMTMALAGGITGFLLPIVMYLFLFKAGLLSCGAGVVILKIAGSTVLGMVCTPIVCRVAGGIDSRMGNVEMKGNIDDVD